MMKKIYSSSSMVYYPHVKKDPEQILQERRRLVKNPTATPMVLEDCSYDLDLYTRCLVASHPNTSQETLERLATDGSTKVCVRVAQNPNATAKVLERLLRATDNVYVLRNVAQHKNASGGTLATLSRSTDLITVLAVVMNSNTMKETLVNLTEHENAQIRTKAFDRLRIMNKQDEKIVIRRTCF